MFTNPVHSHAQTSYTQAKEWRALLEIESASSIPSRKQFCRMVAMLLGLFCRKAGGHSASFPPGNWGLLGHVNKECVDRQGNHMSIMPAQPPARILGDQDDMWGQCEPPKLSQYHLDAIKKSSPGVLQKEARSVPRTNSHEGKSGRERKAWKRRRPAPFFGEVMENPLLSTLWMEGMEEHLRQCFCRANLSVEAASVKRMTQNSANISVKEPKKGPNCFSGKKTGRPPFPPPLPHLTEPWRIFSTHVKRKPRKASTNFSVGGKHCQFGKSGANEGPFVCRVVTMNCSGKIY